LGFIVASVAIWVSYYLSQHISADESMLVLALTVMALAPLIYRVLSIEEEKEESASHESLTGFVTRHFDAICLYCFLFVGLLAAFSFWYVMLPYESTSMPSASGVFGLQDTAISSLRQQITGQPNSQNQTTGSITGQATGTECDLRQEATRIEHFNRLSTNNLKVMAFCFFASFLFGAGALWLIAWNASVIGVFIGSLIKAKLASLSAIQAYAVGFPMYSLSIALWAIPEVLAYLVAAMAGGIVSVAVARHHFTSERFWLTLFDAALFLLISFFLVILGAYVENTFIVISC
jgi:uncharacterized membrane protein SpoIIM required for sporulation